MTRRSPRWALVAGLVLIAATNAAVLGGVAWNRSGEPDATLALTQRELELPFYQIAENTGLSLSLSLGDGPAWETGPAAWLDRTKLAELGFDVHVAPDATDAAAVYLKALPREVFAALEYDGEAWASWLRHKEEQVAEDAAKVQSGQMPEERLAELREELAKERLGHSRLFVVDAARDAATLRQRHPDRPGVAVVPAVVHLAHEEGSAARPARLAGYVEVLVTTLHVPLALRPVLDGVLAEIRAAQEHSERPHVYTPPGIAPPRYQATVAFGRRHEPWLTAVRALPVPE